jgi:hypothetical protein
MSMPLTSSPSPRKDEAGMITTTVARSRYHAGILACVLKTRGSDHRVSEPSPHARYRLAVNRILRNTSCQPIHSESRSIHLNRAISPSCSGNRRNVATRSS